MFTRLQVFTVSTCWRVSIGGRLHSGSDTRKQCQVWIQASYKQTALLQVAEATKAASEAARAVQLAQQKGGAGSSSTASTSVDWSKLVNKPPIFEHATVEAEIKAFRDWSWQVSQYLATIDSSYDDELKKVFDNPSSKLDMESASVETRTRNMILYGLLASLVRGKALNIVKIVGTSDGYEALRHMVLALRPNNNNKTTNNRQRQ